MSYSIKIIDEYVCKSENTSKMESQHNISNGVKQGGCLSPNLFSVYVNHLITKLRSSNLGCRYGNEYMGVYCYADDISLLSLDLKKC